MTGFIINYNGQEIYAALDKGVFNVIISYARDSADISIGGLDGNSFQHIRWLMEKMKDGDEVIIKVSDIEKISGITKCFPHNRDELVERYYKLKEELGKDGLL